jgi:hypothetical protein
MASEVNITVLAVKLDNWVMTPPIFPLKKILTVQFDKYFLTTAKSSELTQYRTYNHLILNKYENGPWRG